MQRRQLQGLTAPLTPPLEEPGNGAGGILSFDRMGASQRLDQLYQELRRRSGMRATRRLVRETLESFICWHPVEEAAGQALQAGD